MNPRSIHYSLLAPLVVAGCVTASTGLPPKGDAVETASVAVTPPPPDEPHLLLSEWGLFTKMAASTPSAGVLEFAPASPLYADYATQRRFVWLPEGTALDYDDTDIWELPEGTILAKTFAYKTGDAGVTGPETTERKLETRILLNLGDTGWKPFVYVWRDDQQDADREIAGDTLKGERIDDEGVAAAFEYSVPNANECAGCHGLRSEGDEPNSPPLLSGGLKTPLGIRTAQLNGSFPYADGSQNQIEHFAVQGWLESPPAPDSRPKAWVEPFGDAPMVERVRSYFAANCAHCHSEGGLASSSSLWLEYGKTDPDSGDPTHWGVCKIPVSAGGGTCGLTYDVVPGNAEASVLFCRVNSAIAKERMPAMGSRVPHSEWVELVRTWINSMPKNDCSAPVTEDE
jgi:uncharacterized repeat protein (TIGR03806 family)